MVSCLTSLCFSDCLYYRHSLSLYFKFLKPLQFFLCVCLELCQSYYSSAVQITFYLSSIKTQSKKFLFQSITIFDMKTFLTVNIVTKVHCWQIFFRSYLHQTKLEEVVFYFSVRMRHLKYCPDGRRDKLISLPHLKSWNYSKPTSRMGIG